jgi:uncharacterized protein YjbI with pentapeptide repeats
MPRLQSSFSGDPQHLEVILRSIEECDVSIWNRWREEKTIYPQLDGANLGVQEGNRPILRGINLANAYLSGAIFVNSCLEGACLRGANVDNAVFDFADLRGADLFGLNGEHSSFEHADLRQANLGSANLPNADFGYAKLDGADFQVADLPNVSFENAQIGNANFHLATLTHANMRLATCIGTDLRHARLERADFFGAYLRGAKLDKADLTETIFRMADLNSATLCGATLESAILVETKLFGTDLSGAWIHGISAWDIKTDDRTKQGEMNIGRLIDPNKIKVETLELAQFLNLLLDHSKLGEFITTMANRVVLILGRFTERKQLLDGLSGKVKESGLLPVIFDFERPSERDFTETIKLLAGLSFFVIADITKPRSVPLELQATVPDCMVPFVPIQQKGEPPFSMFVDLQKKYMWVLPVVKYDTQDDLLAVFDEAIRIPAMEKHLELLKIKREQLEEVDAEKLLHEKLKKMGASKTQA